MQIMSIKPYLNPSSHEYNTGNQITIKNNCVYTYKIEDSVITYSKLADEESYAANTPNKILNLQVVYKKELSNDNSSFTKNIWK